MNVVLRPFSGVVDSSWAVEYGSGRCFSLKAKIHALRAASVVRDMIVEDIFPQVVRSGRSWSSFELAVVDLMADACSARRDFSAEYRPQILDYPSCCSYAALRALPSFTRSLPLRTDGLIRRSAHAERPWTMFSRSVIVITFLQMCFRGLTA